jgi:hypothetical protein
MDIHLHSPFQMLRYWDNFTRTCAVLVRIETSLRLVLGDMMDTLQRLRETSCACLQDSRNCDTKLQDVTSLKTSILLTKAIRTLNFTYC